MEADKTKVLVIEDSRTIGMVEMMLLEKSGHEAKHAATGTEGLRLLEEWQPDILLLDITLPDTDGITILKQINTRPLDKRPDVIVLSAHSNPEVTFDSLRQGAVDFIRKPFHHEEFLLRVSAVEQLRNYRKSNEALQKQLEGDLRKLSRYFSKDVIHSILDGSISAHLGGEIMTATFFIFDLRGSTTMAEQMGPVKFFQFLSEFLGKLSDLIYSCNGSINKFLGDGFLVTFGLRKYDEQATRDALICAMKIRAHIAMYNEVSPPEFANPIGYGIGITTGEVFAGNIGNVDKIEYTILGDLVNLSARLESMTKVAKVDILIDAKTREIGADKLEVRKLTTTAVRGKNQKVDIFYPVDYKFD